MFTTVEEAERAARVVSRITRRKVEVWPEADIGIAVGFADENRFAPGYASWDELAAFLEQGYRPASVENERRAERLAEARAILDQGLGRAILISATPETQLIMDAYAVLACLLEALT